MVASFRALCASVFACCFVTIISFASSVIIVQPPREDLVLRQPPPFAIAEMGFRHELRPRYFSSDLLPIGQGPRNYEYQISLLDGPDGMTVTRDGLLEWIPPLPAGSEVSCDLETIVTEGGTEVFRKTVKYAIRVVEFWRLGRSVGRNADRQHGRSFLARNQHRGAGGIRI